MRGRGFRSILALALAVGTVTAGAAADEKKAAAPMDEKAMMELWQKMASPGEGHKKLDALVGTWTTKTTTWMDPSKPPTVTEGTSEQKWALGGRYLEQRYEGRFMDQPFSGVGYTGYDNFTKKYDAVWMDSAGTEMMMMRGSFDKTGRTLAASGKMNDFATGKPITMRQRTTIVSHDELLFEMWAPGPDGKEYRVMEIRYTRKK